MTFKQLPMNDYTVFHFEVPSEGKEYRFRPFVVKEVKALLVAQGTGDKETMVDTLKLVIRSACLDDNFDIDKLSIFDCEYLMLKLRSISVGETATVRIKCDGEHQENQPKDCRVDINLMNVEVANLDNSKREIKVSENSIVYLNYPSVDMLRYLSKGNGASLTPDEYTEVIRQCIDRIYIGDEVYHQNELDENNLMDWLNNLSPLGYGKLIAFFQSLPYVRLKIEFTCPVCGKKNERFLTGLDAFF